MSAMKTPEELARMGIVVGNPLQPPRLTPEEKEAQRAERRRAARRGSRLEKARKAKLKTARQMRWVEKHRGQWNDYKKRWRRNRRLYQGEVIHANGLPIQVLPKEE